MHRDRMDEEDLIALIDQYIEHSYNHDTADSAQGSNKVTEDRKKALRAYNLDPDLFPYKAGYSKSTTGDVLEVIEWAKPNLLRIFCGSSEKSVEFTPHGPEDVDAAKQATEITNYIIHKQNPSFRIHHNWFHDALLEKVGIVHWYWHTEEKVYQQVYENLSYEELEVILADDSAELTDLEERTIVDEQGVEVEVLVAKVSYSKPHKYVKIVNVPPEDFIMDFKAECIPEARVVGHGSRTTVGELRERYPDLDFDVSELGDGDPWNLYDDLKQVRQGYTSTEEQYLYNDDTESNQPVFVTQVYVRVDYDGDGRSELRRVVKAGHVLFENEEVGYAPYAELVPLILPHRFVGKSYADVVLPIQESNTSITRGVQDNIYLTNHPRHLALDGNRVNLSDLINVKVGGVVRVKEQGAVQPIIVSPLQPETFTMIAYLDKQKERRTGVSETTQGLNDDTLNSHVSANAIAQVSEHSGQKAELLARNFAETGIKSLYLGVYRCFVENAEGTHKMRLSGGWVDIDPMMLCDRGDMTIHVGLGYGNRQERVQKAQMVWGTTSQLLASPMTAKLVNPIHVRNSVKTLYEAADIKNLDDYFLNEEQLQQLMQQPPSPQEQAQQQMMMLEMKVKDAEARKIAAEAEKITKELEVRSMEIQANLESKRLDVRIKELDYNSKLIDFEARKTESQYRAMSDQLELQEQVARSEGDNKRIALDEEKHVHQVNIDYAELELEREDREIDWANVGVDRAKVEADKRKNNNNAS